MGLRINTYSQKDPDGWHCHIDIENHIDYRGCIKLVDTRGFRIGPWPNRKASRRELRGGVRKMVQQLMAQMARDGTPAEAVSFDTHMPDLGNQN